MEDIINTYITENPYEFGVNKQDEHIIQEDAILPAGYVKNPFFINGYRKFSDLDKKEVYSHKKIYVVCLKNNYNNLSPMLFDYGVNQVLFENYCQTNLTVVVGNMKLLSNRTFRNLLIVMKKDDMERYLKEKCDKTELVIPMFETTQQYVERFASLYDEKNNMKDLINLITLSDYLENDTSIISSLFGELKKNQFWSEKDNCSITANDEFLRRNFKFINNSRPKSYTIKDDNYKYLDIGNAIRNSKNRKYFICHDLPKISPEQIEHLFSINNVSEKYLFELFNSFLMSKEYCHLAINKNILRMMTPIIQKYKPVYKYLFGYTWLYFYIEECLQRNYVKNDDRFVIPINTANQLPMFPYSCDDITQNPYVVFNVDPKNYSVTDNFLSVYPINGCGGICDLEEFKKRFNIFCSRSSSVDIFTGVDMDDFGITGSAIPACVQNNPPRFLQNEHKLFDEAWNEYYDRCYESSDIDIMCTKTTLIEYCNSINKFINQLKKNVKELKVEYEKSVSITIEPTYVPYIRNDINSFLGSNLTNEEIIERIKTNDEDLRQYFMIKYVEEKGKFNKTIKVKDNDAIRKFCLFTGTDCFYIKLINYDRFENTKQFLDTDYVHMFTKDIDPTVKQSNNKMIFKMSEGLKVNVSSPNNSFRKLQIWNITQPTFSACVARFHLPCVRGFYNKNNVYLLPSCITALMTGINIDYKYFAGRKEPYDIFMKYRLRGFGIIMNKQELADLKGKIGGYYKPFKLSQFGFDDKEVQYIMCNDDVKKEYGKIIQNFDIFKYKAVAEDGTVNPFQSWIINAFYESMK